MRLLLLASTLLLTVTTSLQATEQPQTTVSEDQPVFEFAIGCGEQTPCSNGLPVQVQADDIACIDAAKVERHDDDKTSYTMTLGLKERTGKRLTDMTAMSIDKELLVYHGKKLLNHATIRAALADQLVIVSDEKLLLDLAAALNDSGIKKCGP